MDKPIADSFHFEEDPNLHFVSYTAPKKIRFKQAKQEIIPTTPKIERKVSFHIAEPIIFYHDGSSDEDSAESSSSHEGKERNSEGYIKSTIQISENRTVTKYIPVTNETANQKPKKKKKLKYVKPIEIPKDFTPKPILKKISSYILLDEKMKEKSKDLSRESDESSNEDPLKPSKTKKNRSKFQLSKEKAQLVAASAQAALKESPEYDKNDKNKPKFEAWKKPKLMTRRRGSSTDDADVRLYLDATDVFDLFTQVSLLGSKARAPRYLVADVVKDVILDFALLESIGFNTDKYDKSVETLKALGNEGAKALCISATYYDNPVILSVYEHPRHHIISTDYNYLFALCSLWLRIDHI
jgi:hypothetical protein